MASLSVQVIVASCRLLNWSDGERWKKQGTLTKTGMINHEGSHREQWAELNQFFKVDN